MSRFAAAILTTVLVVFGAPHLAAAAETIHGLIPAKVPNAT